MIEVTSTTLDVARERLTATVVIDTGDGQPITTNPSFAETDLRALAAAATPPRPDYSIADVITATAEALGLVEAATLPPVEAPAEAVS